MNSGVVCKNDKMADVAGEREPSQDLQFNGDFWQR
jgi:hypothetical protein